MGMKRQAVVLLIQDASSYKVTTFTSIERSHQFRLTLSLPSDHIRSYYHEVIHGLLNNARIPEHPHQRRVAPFSTSL